MKKVKVALEKRSYEILIGEGIFSNLRNLLAKARFGQVAIVVTNPTINNLYGFLIKDVLKNIRLEVYIEEVPDTEGSKSARECIGLIERFANLDRGKGVFVIAFGGGVIGDLAGFAASVYKRGISYIQVPTTLLAQVDSSIGGKVAIDLPCGKNLIGSFYQPRLVLSDTAFLNSLGPEHIKQALAEVIKYAIIADKGFFKYLEDKYAKILKGEQKELEHIVTICSKIKAKIIAQDETDKKGKRMVLNLGHTTAHALEAASGYGKDWPHGYAVASGILVACEISKRLNLITQETLERIEQLIAKIGLPTQISGQDLSDILKAQEYDKKFTAGKNRFVLPICIGKVTVKENIPSQIIAKSIESRMVSKL